MEPKKTKSILNSETAVGIFGVIFGIWWLYLSLQLPGSTAKDGTPGPSVFPVGLAVILIVLSAVMIVVGAKNKITFFDFKSINRENLVKIGVSLALFVVFLLVWSFFHYIPASLILCLGAALIYKIKPIPAVILSVVFSVGTYFAFSKILLVMLDIAK